VANEEYCFTLIGITIDKGFIKSVDEKLVDFFPGLQNDPDKRKMQVTIREVMNQASGLFHEEPAGIPAFLQLPDPSGYVIKALLVSDPGKIFHNSNAATHLLSVLLTKKTGMDTRRFAEQYLFGPMGITEFDWKKMNDGYYDGCGLLSIRLREADMLKIGLLVLHHGKYQECQLVPEK
jgi:CubicO group peptidase (beta-lactamase class C family)